MKLRILLIFVLTSFSFFCQILNAEIIKNIQISGQSKTKPDALLRRLNIHVGDDLTNEEFEDLRVRVSQNPQYILKSVSFKEGTLKIEIEDKWSVIPIPLVSQSGEYYMRGVGIYDNNFLGRLELFVPAIAWTNTGINYLLLYNSENFFTSNFGISSLVVKLNTLSYFYRDGNKVQEFENRNQAFEITPNYFYKNMVFKAGPIFFKRDVVERVPTTNESHQEGAGLRARFHVKFYEQLDTMFKGFFITTNHYVLKPKNKSDLFYHGKFEIISSTPVFNNSFVNFSENIGIASDKTYFYPFSEGAHEGFRGYSGESIHMQKYSASMLQYQQHIWDRLFVIGFYEKTISSLINPVYNGKTLNEDTIGTGIRYYLKKVSIPGINLEYGYNIQDKSHHVHFNLGVKL